MANNPGTFTTGGNFQIATTSNPSNMKSQDRTPLHDDLTASGNIWQKIRDMLPISRRK
jgi:hypothetical protein